MLSALRFFFSTHKTPPPPPHEVLLKPLTKMHMQGSLLHFYSVYSGKIGDELFKRTRGGGGDGY